MTITPQAQAQANTPALTAQAAEIQATKQHITKLAAHQRRLQEMRNGLEKNLSTHPNQTLVGKVKVAGYPPAKLDQAPSAPANPYSAVTSVSKKGK
jgi:hypothetical protein